MPDIRIKQSDVESLARKLDEISDVLTVDERNLLSAVFKIASTMLSRGKSAGETEGATRPAAGREPVASPAAAVAVTPAATTAATTVAAAGPKLSAGFREAFQPILPGANPAGFDLDVHVGW